MGQDLALGQLTEVICQHLAQKNPKKPLVISVHGPPGVGKTYTHLWLARSLYNKQPSADLHCPGMHCKGYKVCWLPWFYLPVNVNIKTSALYLMCVGGGFSRLSCWPWHLLSPLIMSWQQENLRCQYSSCTTAQALPVHSCQTIATALPYCICRPGRVWP